MAGDRKREQRMVVLADTADVVGAQYASAHYVRVASRMSEAGARVQLVMDECASGSMDAQHEVSAPAGG